MFRANVLMHQGDFSNGTFSQSSMMMYKDENSAAFGNRFASKSDSAPTKLISWGKEQNEESEKNKSHSNSKKDFLWGMQSEIDGAHCHDDSLSISSPASNHNQQQLQKHQQQQQQHPESKSESPNHPAAAAGHCEPLRFIPSSPSRSRFFHEDDITPVSDAPPAVDTAGDDGTLLANSHRPSYSSSAAAENDCSSSPLLYNIKAVVADHRLMPPGLNAIPPTAPAPTPSTAPPPSTVAVTKAATTYTSFVDAAGAGGGGTWIINQSRPEIN